MASVLLLMAFFTPTENDIRMAEGYGSSSVFTKFVCFHVPSPSTKGMDCFSVVWQITRKLARLLYLDVSTLKKIAGQPNIVSDTKNKQITVVRNSFYVIGFYFILFIYLFILASRNIRIIFRKFTSKYPFYVA